MTLTSIIVFVPFTEERDLHDSLAFILDFLDDIILIMYGITFVAVYVNMGKALPGEQIINNKGD